MGEGRLGLRPCTGQEPLPKTWDRFHIRQVEKAITVGHPGHCWTSILRPPALVGDREFGNPFLHSPRTHGEKSFEHSLKFGWLFLRNAIRRHRPNLSSSQHTKEGVLPQKSLNCPLHGRGFPDLAIKSTYMASLPRQREKHLPRPTQSQPKVSQGKSHLASLAMLPPLRQALGCCFQDAAASFPHPRG